ncbi:Bifunctional xylanase/xylan deacetylase precursor [Planctomycetes bacterium K23_9]|uniref:Bifunctional xylanase/xylan deacetylase n=2 Tax=Stieleria marina TaxID=1930275 RepID=A0A517NWR4_9BACT|nr:Bifunctional xylanase/xylan deacetylase precursor [Planctomycetes bacterium K23_9]
MLAADCGVAVSQTPEVSAVSVSDSKTAQIVFVDSSIDDISSLVDGLSANHELVLLQPNQDGLNQITEVLARRTHVQSVHIVAHGQAGQVQLGNQLVDADTIQQRQDSLRGWSHSLTDSADILIYGCETGADASGLNLIDQIAKLTGADVAASTDNTGAASLDGNWILERSVGTIESGLAFDARTRQNYTAVMPITIRAQGTTGDEDMALQIDGATVATFEGIGTELQDFTYQTTADARSSEIRVVFTNDLYDEAAGIDRNLIVDSIVVEGTVIQTESPNVFSTGTWKSEDGIVAGFRESETLHSDGYFQFPTVNSGPASEIELFVRGDEGTEQFTLLINGEFAASYQATAQFQSFTYTHNESVVPDDVRIELTSNRWDPANGIDENLTVDYITIDGQTFQTEGSTVYSTGTWTAEDGIVPGFGRGETLHTRGYFQFGSQNDGSQILVRARGQQGFEQFNLVIDGDVVRTFNTRNIGSFQTFVYTHANTVEAEDIRVEFIGDIYDPAQGIDTNLEVDYISVDSKAYQTESPAVFSTGTWTAADGVSPGFRESEVLHSNGYFQFANSSYLADIDAEGDGEWSDVEPLGLIPIHAIVLPDGKVFSFGTTALGMQSGQFIYSIYDPETGEEVVLPNTTDTDIFCSNMSIDPVTGNVMIFGGDARGEGGPVNGAVNDVLVFDYTDMTIRDATQGEMEYDRWYGSSIGLPNGEILVLGGTGGGEDIPEVFNATTGWRTLTGVNMNINYYYPKMWVTSDGSVVVMSNSGSMYRINTAGSGTSQQIGTAGVPHSNASPGVMYDVDKIAFVGTNAKIYVGDLSDANPTFTAVADVQSARRDGGMSMLPDGRVIITGGSTQFNVLSTAVYATEIWDPATNEVEVVEDIELGRLYHSTHLLLPNGTIWAAGGGAPGPLKNLNAEFYAPGYLYNADGTLADRPVITDAPSNVSNSDTFTIDVEDANAIDRITAVRSGALTHAVNSDNRFVELAFTRIDSNTIEVTTLNANMMVPGTWMLFALDADGTPSEAAMLGVSMANIVDTPHLLG